jgi:hypothetical protein
LAAESTDKFVGSYSALISGIFDSRYMGELTEQIGFFAARCKYADRIQQVFSKQT